MPVYTITAPNGKSYSIEGPEGATEEQVRAEVLRRDPTAAEPRRIDPEAERKQVPDFPKTEGPETVLGEPSTPSSDYLNYSLDQALADIGGPNYARRVAQEKAIRETPLRPLSPAERLEPVESTLPPMRFEKPGALKSAAVGTAENIGAGGGAIAGAGLGAALGAFGGPAAFATVPIGALIGGGVGGVTGAIAQRKLEKSLLDEDTLAALQLQRKQAAEEHDKAYMFGSALPSLATGMPVAKMVPTVSNALLGGGFELAGQTLRGEGYDPGKIAIASGLGALGGGSNRLGRAVYGETPSALTRQLMDSEQTREASASAVEAARRAGVPITPAMVVPEGVLVQSVGETRANPAAATRLRGAGADISAQSPRMASDVAEQTYPASRDLTPGLVSDEAARVKADLEARYLATQAEREAAEAQRTAAVETTPQGVVPEVTKGEAGQRTSVSLEKKRTADEAAYRAAYKKLDALGDEPLSPEQASGYKLRLDAAAKALRRKTERTNIPGAESALAQLNVEEPSVLNLLGVRQLIAENQSGATGADAKALADMKNEIDKILGEMRDSPISDAARKAIDARKAYGAKWEGVFEDGKFRPSFLGGLLDKSDEEGLGGLLLGRNANLPAQTGKAVSNFKALRDELGADSPEWTSIRTEVLERALSKDMGKPSFGNAFDTWVRNNPELANLLVPPGAEDLVKAARGDIRKADAMLQEAARRAEAAKADRVTGMEPFLKRVAATELGQGFMSMDSGDFARRLTSVNPAERNLTKVGVRQAVRDAIKTPAASFGVLNELAENIKAQANLRALLGDDEAFEIITNAKAASAVLSRAEDLQGLARGAQRRGPVQEGEGGVDLVPKGLAIQSAPSGTQINLFSSALNNLTRLISARGVNRAEALELAEDLLDPTKTQAVVDQLAKQVGAKDAELAMRRARAFHAETARRFGTQMGVQTIQAMQPKSEPPSAEQPPAEETPAETAEFTSVKTPNDVIPKERAVDVAVPIIAGERVEGTGDNPNSTASGYGQFIDDTFVAYYRKVRPEESKDMSEAQILAQRGTGVEKDMMRAYTQDSVNRLERENLPITVRNIYALHHMGHGAGPELLKADPNASASAILGQKVLNRNPTFATFLKENGDTAANALTWLEQHAAKGITPDAS